MDDLSLCDKLRKLSEYQKTFVELTNDLGNDGSYDRLVSFYDSLFPGLKEMGDFDKYDKNHLKLFDSKDMENKILIRNAIIEQIPGFDFINEQKDLIRNYPRDPLKEIEILHAGENYYPNYNHPDYNYINTKIHELFVDVEFLYSINKK